MFALHKLHSLIELLKAFGKCFAKTYKQIIMKSSLTCNCGKVNVSLHGKLLSTFSSQLFRSCVSAAKAQASGNAKAQLKATPPTPPGKRVFLSRLTLSVINSLCSNILRTVCLSFVFGVRHSKRSSLTTLRRKLPRKNEIVKTKLQKAQLNQWNLNAQDFPTKLSRSLWPR